MENVKQVNKTANQCLRFVTHMMRTSFYYTCKNTPCVFSSCSWPVWPFRTYLPQDNTSLAKDLQTKYKDSPVAILKVLISLDFSKDPNRHIWLESACEDNGKIPFTSASIPKLPRVWYMTTILKWKNFRHTPNRRCPDKTKILQQYTSEGYFYDDSKFCTQVLNLKELGEVWSMNIVKSRTMPSEPASYFQDEYLSSTENNFHDSLIQWMWNWRILIFAGNAIIQIRNNFRF